MKYVIFPGSEDSTEPSLYVAYRWAEGLAARGNEVELAVSFLKPEMDLDLRNIKVKLIISGEEKRSTGDAYFFTEVPADNCLESYQGLNFVLWNRYAPPPDLNNGKLVCFSRVLQEFVEEHYSAEIIYIPPALDQRIFQLQPLAEEVKMENKILFMGNENSPAEFKQTLKALDLLCSSLPDLKLYYWGMKEQDHISRTPAERIELPSRLVERLRLFYGLKAVIWSCPGDARAFIPYPLEVMAAGRPLICYTLRGMDDILLPGKNCTYLSPVSSPEQITVEILRILRLGQLREQLIARGRQDLRSYNLEVSASEIERATLNIMGLKDKGEGIPVAVPQGEEVDIVIVNHNTRDLLEKCLESIKDNTEYPHRLIVVDNGSSDSSKDYLNSQPEVLTIFNETNEGYARACNKGAVAGRGKYILFLNTDVEVTPGWLERMVKCARSHERVAVVGPKMVNEDDLIVGAGVTELSDVCSPRGWKEPDGESVFAREEEVINVSGACYLIKREILPRLGLFDERFFFYYEETDYSLRAREKGYRVMYCPQAKIIHQHEGSLKEIDRNLRNKYFAMSRQLFTSKWQELLAGEEKRSFKKNILVLGLIPWNMRYQRPQQLLTRFAQQGYRVLYVNPYCSAEGLKEYKKNLYTYSPPGYGRAILNLRYRENRQKMAQHIKKALRGLGMENPVLWVDAPYWEPLIMFFEYNILLYNCMDAYGEFIDLKSHPSLEMEERRLVKISDLIITPSRTLYEEKKEENASTFYIPNGADNETFNSVAHEGFTLPSEIRGLEEPIILYYGAIAGWFDIELMEGLAERMKKGSLVLLGEVTVDVSELEENSRVFLLGEKDYWDLPAFLQGSHLCIIPFCKNRLTEATDPVKVYEYLAAGRPVISVKLPELERFSDVITLADGDDFITAVLKFIDAYPQGLPEDERKILQSRVKEEDWEKRVQDIAQLWGQEDMGREEEEGEEQEQIEENQRERTVLADEDEKLAGEDNYWGRIKEWFSTLLWGKN